MESKKFRELLRNSRTVFHVFVAAHVEKPNRIPATILIPPEDIHIRIWLRVASLETFQK